MIRTGNLYGQKFTFQDLKYVTHSFHELNKKSQTRKGDILIARHGSSGSAVLVPSSIEEANTLNIVIIRTIANELDNIFAQYAINSDGVRKQVLEVTAGSTQGVINTGEIAKLIIPKPTINEQRAIAETLSDMDALIESLEQLIAKKRQIKQGAMQELLTGKRRLPGFSEEWETHNLRRFVRSFIVPMRDKPKRFSGDIPWCRIEDFDGIYLRNSKSDRRVDTETIHTMNLKVYPTGTLLVSCSADLGRCAIVARPLVSNQTFIGLDMDETVSSNLFFYYYMKSKADELNNLSSGTTISYLSREQFEEFGVFVPCDKREQEAIASILYDMDSEIVFLEEKLAKARQIKQGMMQELLTGRIRLI